MSCTLEQTKTKTFKLILNEKFKWFGHFEFSAPIPSYSKTFSICYIKNTEKIAVIVGLNESLCSDLCHIEIYNIVQAYLNGTGYIVLTHSASPFIYPTPNIRCTAVATDSLMYKDQGYLVLVPQLVYFNQYRKSGL